MISDNHLQVELAFNKHIVTRHVLNYIWSRYFGQNSWLGRRNVIDINIAEIVEFVICTF